LTTNEINVFFFIHNNNNESTTTSSIFEELRHFPWFIFILYFLLQSQRVSCAEENRIQLCLAIDLHESLITSNRVKSKPCSTFSESRYCEPEGIYQFHMKPWRARSDVHEWIG
jgi:hypothetical protein